MSIHRLANLTLLLLAAAFLVVGCGSDPLGTDGQGVGGDNSIDEIDLDEAFGGLSYTDEAAAFGDELLLAEAQASDTAALTEDDEDDVLDDDPSIRDHPDLRRTYFKILWGQLDGRPEEFDREMAVDWSGKLEVTGGIVAVKRTIRFEPRTDRLLPRSNRHTVAWQSWTGPHNDGLLLCVLSRPDSTGAYSGELSFRTGPFSQTFQLADLPELEETYSVDDQGNSISFEAVEVDRHCPRGFLGGFWNNVPDQEGGVIRGHWIGEHGRITGHVRGRYGLTGDGEKVFAGKIIDRMGRIRGLMRGTWEPNGDGTGQFAGHWVTRFGNIEGRLAGRYMSLDTGGAGFFMGRWGANCGAGDGDDNGNGDGDGNGDANHGDGNNGDGNNGDGNNGGGDGGGGGSH